MSIKLFIMSYDNKVKCSTSQEIIISKLNGNRAHLTFLLFTAQIIILNQEENSVSVHELEKIHCNAVLP